jgi:hypothetical protein
MSGSENPERDTKIIIKRRKGHTCRELAKEYGLSTPRVSQICAKASYDKTLPFFKEPPPTGLVRQLLKHIQAIRAIAEEKKEEI